MEFLDNKQDKTFIPQGVSTLSSSEWNKVAGEIISIIRYTGDSVDILNRQQVLKSLLKMFIGAAIYLPAFDFGDPTETSGQPWNILGNTWNEALNTYALNLHPDWSIGIPNSAVVKNLFDNILWIYNLNNETWVDDGQDTVAEFTNHFAGIIKGANNNPQNFGIITAIGDGYGAVIGLSDTSGGNKFLSGDGTYKSIANSDLIIQSGTTPQIALNGGSYGLGQSGEIEIIFDIPFTSDYKIFPVSRILTNINHAHLQISVKTKNLGSCILSYRNWQDGGSATYHIEWMAQGK